MNTKFNKCPVCNSPIKLERIDDGFTIFDIADDGELDESVSQSNGRSRFYCSNDESHKLPQEQIDELSYHTY